MQTVVHTLNFGVLRDLLWHSLCRLIITWSASSEWEIYFCQQNGTLKIIDRKKHIFKLAQGEYIAPEKIENVYLRSEALAQVFVHGESLQVGILWVIKNNARKR